MRISIIFLARLNQKTHFSQTKVAITDFPLISYSESLNREKLLERRK